MSDEQKAFWNGTAGENWTRHAADLDALHAQVTALICAAAPLRSGARVLDIGCGAGDTALAAAAAVGPEGRVTGLDISRPLLSLAKVRAQAAEAGNLDLVEGDAGGDDLGGPHDVVLSRFGLMFFDDPVAAFAHIRAAIRPGGQIVFAAWGSYADNPWFGMAREAAEERLGQVPLPPPGAPGPTAFADTARVAGLLRQAGFADAAGRACRLLLGHSGGAEALSALAVTIGPAASVIGRHEGGAADRAAIRREIRDRLARFETPGGIQIPATVNLFTATAP